MQRLQEVSYLDGLPLKPFQKAALEACESLAYPQHHVLCVSPTGSGKSRIYEIAAQKKGRRTLIITPLIALARQQAQQLRQLKLNVYWNKENLQPSSHHQVWITSPEGLLSKKAQSQLRNWQPHLLVVDECHCIWEWGQDFRPAFQLIPHWISLFSIPKSLWLTATLPPLARQQLKTLLPPQVTEIGCFNLPPHLVLRIVTLPPEERLTQLTHLLLNQTEATLLFVPTRSLSVRLGKLVSKLGRKTRIYHAGMSWEERQNQEKTLMAKLGKPTAALNQGECLLATSAFGMGMNLLGLVHVILWQAPPSLLSLVQAIGRVGRQSPTTEQPVASTATLFWHPQDFESLGWMLRSSPQRRQDFVALQDFLQKTHQASPEVQLNYLRNYFNGWYEPKLSSPPLLKGEEAAP